MTIVEHQYLLHWPNNLEGLAVAISSQDEHSTRSLLREFPESSIDQQELSGRDWSNVPDYYTRMHYFGFTLPVNYYLLTLYTSHETFPQQPAPKIPQKVLDLLGIPNLTAKQSVSKLEGSLEIKKRNIDFLVSIGWPMPADQAALPPDFSISENPLNYFLNEICTAFQVSTFSACISVESNYFEPLFESLLLTNPTFDEKTLALIDRFDGDIQRRLFLLAKDNESLLNVWTKVRESR